MKRLIYLCSVALLFVSCSNEQPEQHGFSITGKVLHAPESNIYLQELTPKGLRLLDSATLGPDGSFEFSGTIPEKIFCTISFPKGATVLVVDTSASVSLSIDAEMPEQFGVAGSPDTEALKKLLQINNKYMLTVRSMESKYTQYANGEVPPASVQEQIRAEYDSLMNGRRQEMQHFVTSLDQPLVAYFATNFLMPESDFDFLEQVDRKFYARFNQSKYAQEHHTRVEDLRKTAVGQPAPDIVMPDPFGKTIALSSLRGKYVLVDFWASWCKPCRQESANLVRLYNKYKTRGFDIFSVSLDDDRNAWQQAINDDHLLWTHVSDLRKWNSDVVNKYKIEAIPFTVVLDKDGKILAKNLSGEALDKKLAELMP